MSTKAQSSSVILLREPDYITPLHELIQREMVRWNQTVKEVSDVSRLSPSRIREFLNGKDLPSRREFRRLCHALTNLSYQFPEDRLATESNTSPPRTATGPDATEESMSNLSPPRPAPPAPVTMIRLGKQAALLSTSPETSKLVEFLAQCAAANLTLPEVIEILKD